MHFSRLFLFCCSILFFFLGREGGGGGGGGGKRGMDEGFDPRGDNNISIHGAYLLSLTRWLQCKKMA